MIGFSGLAGFKPSDEQFRFMVRCWGSKAHLDRIHGEWRCVGRHAYGYGATPFIAHANWLQEIEARADWERRR